MSNNKKLISETIAASIATKQLLLESERLVSQIEIFADTLVQCFKNDGKVFFCGNGGSAADAQHISAELTGRFYLDRKPLYSEAFHVNSSYMTAVANDYGYDKVYSRMAEACCRKGDVLVGISTSGNSKNIIEALKVAKKQGATIIGMTGDLGGEMVDLVDVLINVPSNDTPRIQESHILVGHIICDITEKTLFGE
ncbi:D-sedoheptulose 7-phosphate isomerase [Vicingaceae bacterium]|nr:D-sedoheptulose 7-phosphate isomerase [Vicingaceae bacterium]